MSKGTPFFLLEQIAIDAGAALGGAQLYFYQTGTTTDQDVYTEAALSSTHAQPVVADSGGTFADIWLNPDESVDYRVRLEDSDSNLIFQVDNVPRYRENFESGSFTVTWAGFSADPGNTSCSWYRIGSVISLTIPLGTGTSNLTTFSFSGLPAALVPDSAQYLHFPYAQDSGAHLAGGAVGIISGTVIKFAPADVAYSLAGWTASGAKGIETIGNAFYRLRDS